MATLLDLPIEMHEMIYAYLLPVDLANLALTSSCLPFPRILNSKDWQTKDVIRLLAEAPLLPLLTKLLELERDDLVETVYLEVLINYPQLSSAMKVFFQWKMTTPRFSIAHAYSTENISLPMVVQAHRQQHYSGLLALFAGVYNPEILYRYLQKHGIVEQVRKATLQHLPHKIKALINLKKCMADTESIKVISIFANNHLHIDRQLQRLTIINAFTLSLVAKVHNFTIPDAFMGMLVEIFERLGYHAAALSAEKNLYLLLTETTLEELQLLVNLRVLPKVYKGYDLYSLHAQMAEHAAENRGVGSSILPLATSPRLASRRLVQFRFSWPRASAQRVMTD